MVSPELGSSLIPAIERSLAAVIPPKRARIAATMKTTAIASMRVAPKEVTFPIQAAPWVEIHVAMKKITIEMTATAQVSICTPLPAIM